METASIVPTPYLECTAGANYHLALAHLIGSDLSYTQFYRNCEDYVILDNGVYEDAQVSMMHLIDIAIKIKADEIILIDKMEDSKATIQSARYCFFILNKCLGEDKTEWPNIMAVAQGEDLTDWYKCARELLSLPIDCLAVPKVLLKHGADARARAVHGILPLLEGRSIHLLGGGENPFEPHQINEQSEGAIRSVDSSLPFVYAVAGKKITDGKRPDVIIDFENPQDCDKQLLIDNINTWKEDVD